MVLFQDQEVIHQWPSKEQIEHIQDTVINRYNIDETTYIEFHILQEKELFGAFSKSIQLMMVQKIMSYEYNNDVAIKQLS